MNKKSIVLITGTEGTRVKLHDQLESYIGEYAFIESFAIDLGIHKKIDADLVVISTSIIYEDALKHIEKECPIIVARRIINYSEIERMLFIPSGEDILFVNDCEETTLDSIEWLKKLGIDGYNYIPFYPGCSAPSGLKYAVTPGEKDIAPSYIENIIDIGPRLMDITTITEILKELNLFEDKWNEISTMYLNKIIIMGKSLVEISREKTEAYNHVVKVIDSVNEGLIAFDRDGIITVFNENLKYMLGTRKSNLVGRYVSSAIAEKSLREFILQGKYEASRIFQLRGEEYLLNKFRIKEDGTTVVTFKNTIKNIDSEREARRELYKRGYYGKYTFEDIIGESSAIKDTKSIGKKLALTDLTVLIEGESGTGKELFASAIHNASSRRYKPFVAVNFSSLSENLVESELFGYEEGAFTGAAKGGKTGLFEQAQGGTIFLDEIGDISPRVQARLLRVLQEKEILRVGGNKIIPIDVRIIAATNAKLSSLVQEGNFRADLYHRLKVLYLKLPPLRDRKEDILPLVKQFIRLKGKENISIDDKVIKKLMSYPWTGNVRELKNTMEYILAVCNGESIGQEDLPEESFFSQVFHEKETKGFEISARGDLIFILKELHKLNVMGEKGSRQALAEAARLKSFNLSEQMIRNRLEELETQGYIKKNRGKAGTTITTKGIEAIKVYDL